MSKTQDLYRKAKRIIPGGTQLLSKRPEMMLPEIWPAYYQKAEGCRVWDLDGNVYTDMSYMSVGACILGYSDKDVNNAVKRAIDSASMTTLNCPEEVELAEVLCDLHPWADMARFARTGGEALSMAIRIARAATGKETVLFCGYHGWHDWYLAANLAEDDALDGHLISGLSPKGVPRGLKGTAKPFNYNDIDGFKRLVDENRDSLAAVILEPIRQKKPDSGFLKAVRDAVDSAGSVLIADEVSAGWRITLGGSHKAYNLEPDMAVFAKGMSNGFPMSAVIGKEQVMHYAQETFISSTYWTDSIGPVAALSTIKKLKEKNVAEHIKAMGCMVQDGWIESARKHQLDITVSSREMAPLSTFTFNHDLQPEMKTLFTQLMLEKKFLATCAFYGSWAHKKDNVTAYLDAMDSAFSVISESLENNNIPELLKGPVCQAGFKRLN